MPVNEIVRPQNTVFSFIGSDGKDLRDLAIELNDQWATYVVKRNGDKATLRELEKTIDSVKEKGIDRQSIVNLEAMNLGPLNSKFPANSYTLRPSKTNSKVALEEVDLRIIQMLQKMIKHFIALVEKGIALLKKNFPLLKNRREKIEENFPKVKDEVNASSESLQGSEIKTDPDLGPAAEALEERFTLLDMVLSDPSGKMPTAFANVVKEISNVVNGAMDDCIALTRLLEEAGNSSLGSIREKVKAFSSTETPMLIKYASLVSGLRPETTQEALSDISNWASQSRNSPGEVDPFNLHELRERQSYLVEILDPENTEGPFIFPAALLDELTRLTDNMERMTKAGSSAVSRIKRSQNESHEVVSEIVEAMSHVELSFRAATSVIGWGENFYVSGYQALVVLNHYIGLVDKKAKTK